MQKRMLILSVLMLALALSGCGAGGAGRKPAPSPSPSPTPSAAVEQKEEKVIRGTINRIGSYLVLLTGEGEYQVMDFGEGVTADGFAEGDQVDVTYTGELGAEDTDPVIQAMEKVE